MCVCMWVRATNSSIRRRELRHHPLLLLSISPSSLVSHNLSSSLFRYRAATFLLTAVTVPQDQHTTVLSPRELTIITTRPSSCCRLKHLQFLNNYRAFSLKCREWFKIKSPNSNLMNYLEELAAKVRCVLLCCFTTGVFLLLTLQLSCLKF